eukprot:382402-Pelagomonas_calceolata.AAC.4
MQMSTLCGVVHPAGAVGSWWSCNLHTAFPTIIEWRMQGLARRRKAHARVGTQVQGACKGWHAGGRMQGMACMGWHAGARRMQGWLAGARRMQGLACSQGLCAPPATSDCGVAVCTICCVSCCLGAEAEGEEGGASVRKWRGDRPDRRGTPASAAPAGRGGGAARAAST